MDGMFTPYYAMSELNLPSDEKKIRNRFLKLVYDYKDAKTTESVHFFKSITPEDWAMGQANIQINILRNSKVAIQRQDTNSDLEGLSHIFVGKSHFFVDFRIFHF